MARRASHLRDGLLEGVGTPPSGASSRWRSFEAKVDCYFDVSQRGSTLATEFRAGTTAFLAASNNFVVNAHIMQHAGIDPGVSVVSGAFASAVTCILSGFISNLPLGLVPSVGPNVFLAFSLVAKGVVTTEGALAISGATGLFMLTLSLTPVLKVILGLVPLCIKYGLIIGTGLLTALIGLKNIGVVVPDEGPSNDIVALGTLEDRRVIIAGCFLVIMASMLHRGVKGAVLIGMIGATITEWAAQGDWPGSFVDFRSLTPHAVDLSVLAQGTAWVQVGALMLMLLFSISGALIGSGRMAGLLLQDGILPGSTAVYIACGIGTLISALLGSSPIFVSMSAAAGIRDGGRTGLMSIVIGMYALLTAFLFSPLAADIPNCAVSPVLILVGVAMIGEAKEVAWWSMQEALPAFLCAIFQPFTYSVSNGIFVGVGMSFVLFFTTGNFLAYLPNHGKYAASTTPGLVSPGRSIRRHPSSSEAHSLDLVLKSINAQIHGAGLYDHCDAPQQSSRQSTPPMERTYTLGKLSRRSLLSDTVVANLDSGREPAVRQAFSKVGRESRLQAMSLIEHAARLVGLDPEEVKHTIEARLIGGARNTESHCMGGMCGSEAQLACDSLYGSVADFGSMAAAEAPFVAAAAWRLRLKGMEEGEGDVRVVQSEEVDE